MIYVYTYEYMFIVLHYIILCYVTGRLFDPVDPMVWWTSNSSGRDINDNDDICIYIYIYTHLYIYIYIERERDTYTYIYIYTHYT